MVRDGRRTRLVDAVMTQNDVIVASASGLFLRRSEHTGQPLERIAKDTDRDFFLSAEESKKYGMVDDVLTKIPGPEGADEKD